MYTCKQEDSTLQEFLAVFAILRAGASASSVFGMPRLLVMSERTAVWRKREKSLEKDSGISGKVFSVYVSRFILDFESSLKNLESSCSRYADIPDNNIRSASAILKRKSYSCRERSGVIFVGPIWYNWREKFILAGRGFHLTPV